MKPSSIIFCIVLISVTINTISAADGDNWEPVAPECTHWVAMADGQHTVCQQGLFVTDNILEPWLSCPMKDLEKLLPEGEKTLNITRDPNNPQNGWALLFFGENIPHHPTYPELKAVTSPFTEMDVALFIDNPNPAVFNVPTPESTMVLLYSPKLAYRTNNYYTAVNDTISGFDAYSQLWPYTQTFEMGTFEMGYVDGNPKHPNYTLYDSNCKRHGHHEVCRNRPILNVEYDYSDAPPDTFHDCLYYTISGTPFYNTGLWHAFFVDQRTIMYDPITRPFTGRFWVDNKSPMKLLKNCQVIGTINQVPGTANYNALLENNVAVGKNQQCGGKCFTDLQCPTGCGHCNGVCEP